MIRSLAVAFALIAAVPAFAQTSPAPQERQRLAPEQREQRRAEIRQAREACRDEVSQKGLRGPQRREAMKSCLIAKKPELAKPLACADEARAKGLKDRDERRAFMRTCVRGG
jgi:hypothetical protein